MPPAAPAAGENVTLRDGTELLVRSIMPDDKAAIDRAFHRLSPESRYRRFFSPRTHLTDRDLAYLTEIDHHDHEALAAIDPPNGEIVGVARYVRTEGLRGEASEASRGGVSPRAEASVVVADDWQQRGVGSALLDRLATRAREAGVTHFLALVLAGNQGAIELFEHFAPDDPERRTRDGYVELVLELPAPEEMRGSPLARALREAASGVVTMNPWSVLSETIQRGWHNRPGR